MNYRTQVGQVEQGRNGQWRSALETYMGEPGQEFLANTITSAPVWATEDEALDGARRALEVLEATGKFPNMCEPW